MTHFLPSGKYQVAMVPYIKDENGTMVAMAPPSCSCRLEKIDLGKYILIIIFGKNHLYTVHNYTWPMLL